MITNYINIDVGKLKGKADKKLSSMAKRYMEKYVPLQDGTLRNTAVVGNNYVRYVQNYASLMYNGISPSGKPYNYKTPRNRFTLGHKDDECWG